MHRTNSARSFALRHITICADQVLLRGNFLPISHARSILSADHPGEKRTPAGEVSPAIYFADSTKKGPARKQGLFCQFLPEKSVACLLQNQIFLFDGNRCGFLDGNRLRPQGQGHHGADQQQEQVEQK